jgi:hypothetical protein
MIGVFIHTSNHNCYAEPVEALRSKTSEVKTSIRQRPPDQASQWNVARDVQLTLEHAHLVFLQEHSS